MKSYKLATYRATQGPRAGIVVEEEVFDAAALTGRSSYATMLAILNDWEVAQTLLEKAAEMKERKGKGIPLEKARLLVPVLYPSAIFCAGQLCRPHAGDGGSPKDRAGPRSPQLGT
jgi:hypothetical protein